MRARRNSGLEIQSPAVVRAYRDSDAALTRAGVRHLVCGGLAVAMHGYVRMTKDVDFLVGPEAFERAGRLVYPKPGIPIMHGEVAIDLVTMPEAYDSLTEEELTTAQRVVSVEFLLYNKLLVYRPRDRIDVVELLRVDASRERRFLDRFVGSRWLTPDLRARFDEAVRESSTTP